MRKVVILALFVLGQVDVILSDCNTTLDAATYASERVANGVELKFYRVQTGTWTEEGNSNKVAAQVISHANTYCEANPTACGLQNCCASNFKESLVIVASEYPKNSLKDLLFKISLDFPEDLNSTGTPQCVMGKSVLQSIIERAREDIHDDTGYWITYIDDNFFGIPPPTELNKIIIPIAFAAILGLIILTIILNFWNKRKEESLRRKKVLEQRKKSKLAKESPVYNVDKKEPRPAGGPNQSKPKPKRSNEQDGSHSSATFAQKSPVRKDQLYKDNLRQSNMSEKKTGSQISEDSAIKVDGETTRQRQPYSYEKQSEGATGYSSMEMKGMAGSHTDGPPSHLKPIEYEADEDTRSPEKKKKKKKKRSKSKEVMDVNNTGYTNEDENEAYE